MSKIDCTKFTNSLQKAKTEEDVKSVYAKLFGIQYDTSDRHDLYTPQVLFEFKYNRNFEAIKTRATVLAQILYYVRKLKFGGYTDKPISPILCLADQKTALLTETILWKEFYTDETDKYDWDLAPSNPDALLVKDLSQTTLLQNIHLYQLQQTADCQVFAELLQQYLNPQNRLVGDKKVITEANFEDIFQYWNNIFGDAVRNGLKTSRYFVTDIQEDNTLFIKAESKAVFQFSNGEAKVKKILARDYEHFWSLYEKVTNADTIRSILAKIDRLSDDFMRRFHGEFFTPIPFAKKALDYLEKTLGKQWWQSGEYRLWDMAAGTGNLEYGLPQEALPYCYLSTLYVEDVEHLQKLFSGATIFQYDYLNDDVQNVFWGENAMKFELTWKLPEKLRKDLANPKIKWVILINPPFATAQIAGTGHGDSKEGVADTKIRKKMHEEDLGEVSRELAMQFIFRLKKEIKGQEAHLGLFYKIKHLNSNNDNKLRDTIFKFQYEKGFVFSSAAFSGTSQTSPFPIAFMLWNLNKEKPLQKQKIILDIFDLNVEKIGLKTVKVEKLEKHLSKWIKRPAATVKFPPLGSALDVKATNKDRRDRIAQKFLASLMCKGNDFQNQNFTALLSAPYVSAGALSVTPENFEQAMVVHAVRRIPKATWLNDRDQFMQPNADLSKEFIRDCTIWNLFSNSNQTASLKDVVYEGVTYQIYNHFFPFLLSEVKQWKIADADIRMTLATGEDSFVAKWLAQQLSAGGKPTAEVASLLLAKGKEIYQLYFASLGQLNTTKFKIQRYDAGWYQIRNAMADVYIGQDLFEELKVLHNQLKEQLLPEIEAYGFI